MTSILVLDASGTPNRWIPPRKAAKYLAEEMVAWSLGEPAAVLRGGTNAVTGVQSTMQVPAIMAIKGQSHRSRSYATPGVDREALFVRDRHLCAYCGQVFKAADLTADHVIPESRGGEWSWTNLVSACAACNGFKANRSPEEARTPLLYLPYVPNLHEHFILSGRRILADQFAYLMCGVAKNSRLHD